MKKNLLAVLVLTTASLNAFACDICGGINHLNPYLFPHLSRSYVGWSYLHNQYRLQQSTGLLQQTSQTVVLTGQYAVSNKLRLTALLPYQYTKAETQGASVTRNGLGDATVLAAYQLWQKTSQDVQQAISLGAGVKLPTGTYNAQKADVLTDPNFQLGSGSLDYLLNATYRIKAGSFAFNVLGAYKYTTSNKEGYRYGDILTAGATAIYVIKAGNLSLAPYLQAVHETHYIDADAHILQEHSGGHAFYTGGGLDITAKQITVGLNYQVAAQQNLMQGELEAKPRLSARFSFSF